MGAMVRDRIYIGHVVREADDIIVVFSDTDDLAGTSQRSTSR